MFCKVYIKRGGHIGFDKGSYRFISAKYIDTQNNEVICELLEDDPLAVVEPLKKGEIGYWSKSIMYDDEFIHCGSVHKPNYFKRV